MEEEKAAEEALFSCLEESQVCWVWQRKTETEIKAREKRERERVGERDANPYFYYYVVSVVSVWGFLLLSYCIATAASVSVFVCVILPVVGVCTTLPLQPPRLLPSNYTAPNKNLPSDGELSPMAVPVLCSLVWVLQRPAGVRKPTRSPISRVQRPACPVVTPPINHHWLTAPAMTPAWRKRESPFPPFRMMDEDGAQGPKDWDSMECEAVWRVGKAGKLGDNLLKDKFNLIKSWKSFFPLKISEKCSPL